MIKTQNFLMMKESGIVKTKTELLKKIITFLKDTNSLKYLDPNIFEMIDNHKETIDLDYEDYFLKYVSNLPKLDFENVVKISREVYQIYGKEKEFDAILERLLNNYCINPGSLNKEDNNCITNAKEDSILLSGTCYDVVLLCHEIGHKIRCENYVGPSDIMDSFFFETPSIMIELTAGNYLRDNYGIDINIDELRKKHVLSLKRNTSVENKIFFIILNLQKERKLNVLNIYRVFMNNKDIIEYLSKPNTSIRDCVDLVLTSYAYDIGYIVGIHNDNNKGLLNTILTIKDNGLNCRFSMEEEMIKSALEDEKYTK